MSSDPATHELERRPASAAPSQRPALMGSPPPVIEEVIAALEREPARRILDAPAGEGALLQRLIERGHDAEALAAADIFPELLRCAGIACRRADLNVALPFADACFDAALCTNGIHRLYAPGRAIYEFARVLRPGGRLIISGPNYASIQRRMRFFLHGTISRATLRAAAIAEQPEAHLKLPITIAQIAAAAHASGLQVERVRGVRSRPGKLRPGRVVYLPWIALIKLATSLARTKTRARLHLGLANRFDVLFSDFIVLEARRIAETLPPPGRAARAGRVR